MKYSKFFEMDIPRLGFGTMRLPMLENGKIDREETAKMVKLAMDSGLNYFDTAWGYHSGESEEAMGEILSKYPRESYYLVTKMPTWLCNSKQDVLDIFQKQLEHLRTSYFDLYLIHSIDDGQWQNIKNVSVFNALLEEKAAGRIKHLGASFHCSLELLDEILAEYGPVLEFVQLQINYHDWDFAKGKELHEIALKYNKPIIIMEPLRGGMLAKLTEETSKMYREHEKQLGVSRSNAYYAFKYADELENVFITLSGMESMDVLKENLEIFDTESMTEDDYGVIHEVAEKLKDSILIPCTGCNYCYDCPSKIKIKEIFAAYNEAASKNFHEIWGHIYDDYDQACKENEKCIECGKCQSICPQHIEIIEKLKDVEKKFDSLR